MLTKDDLEQIGRLLQAQNENTKLLIEASEKRIKSEVKLSIEKSQEQVLETIIRTADGVVDEVKKDQEKEMKRLEQKIDTVVTDHEDRIATLEHEVFNDPPEN